MKLSELEASFIGDFRMFDADGNKATQWREINTVEGAQGISFICPKCQGHNVLVPFANPRNAPVIPQEAFEKIKFRWKFSGETIDSVSIQPSIDLSNKCHPGDCDWHGFVTNGEAA